MGLMRPVYLCRFFWMKLRILRSKLLAFSQPCFYPPNYHLYPLQSISCSFLLLFCAICHGQPTKTMNRRPNLVLLQKPVREDDWTSYSSICRLIIIIFKIMSTQENYHRRFRGYKVDSELQGVKDASLSYTMQQIQVHCQKVTAKTPEQMANCINLNCASQKYYIDCFEVLKNRKECIKNLRFEVEQNGQYRLSHLKTD